MYFKDIGIAHYNMRMIFIFLDLFLIPFFIAHAAATGYALKKAETISNDQCRSAIILSEIMIVYGLFLLLILIIMCNATVCDKFCKDDDLDKVQDMTPQQLLKSETQQKEKEIHVPKPKSNYEQVNDIENGDPTKIKRRSSLQKLKNGMSYIKHGTGECCCPICHEVFLKGKDICEVECGE